jgi:hypothetical protein
MERDKRKRMGQRERLNEKDTGKGLEEEEKYTERKKE